jgi:hydrogenase/urease accessory protein HupE
MCDSVADRSQQRGATMPAGPSHALILAVMLVPGAALAHPGHGGDHAFVHDLGHLVGGLDYLLAIALVCAGGFAVRRLARAARSSPLRP